MRQTLTPLAPGERPVAVTVGALIALALCTANVALLAFGAESINGARSSPVSFVIYALVMVLVAGGMWRTRNWAVLGFMVMLLITILVATLALTRASNLLGVLIPTFVIGGGSWLFFKLVRALSRIQAPRPPG
ncbi:MAG: hypothetical protein ACR2IP_07345 [Solirubrobacteraceae bacterium]